MKRCTRCSSTKPLVEFAVNRRNADGRQPHCRECDRERVRRYRAKNRGKVRDSQRRRYAANPEAARGTMRHYQAANREAVFDYYGRVCACCGITERLTIDHVDGGGTQHRRDLFGHDSSGSAMYYWLVKNNFPAGYQVLCIRCNCSKGAGAACRLDHSARVGSGS